MAIDVKIPPMGESITSGILANWRVKDGDTVKRNQPLFELETDKITSEGVAEADGVIRLKVEAGTEVKIGQVVATIEPGAAPGSNLKSEISDLKSPTPEASAAPAAQAPSVRRLAAETGIDPASIAGTGKAGRVTKGDMLQAAENFQKSAPSPAPEAPASQISNLKSEIPPAAATVASSARSTRRRLTPLRAKIAERLVQAKNQTAMLTTFNEVDMTAVRELRARYQEDFTKKYGIKLGFMSFFVKAAVHALKEVPAINAFLDGDTIIENHYHDIGVAVSTERGLMVPVLRECADKTLAQIEGDLGAYAKKARDGKITLDDLNGGVFTITNGGIFGSLLSTPILNPPQSAILGMHAIQDRPIALNGQVVIRPMMYLALSYDHRLVDGKEAVTFLVKVKQAIEDPARLLLGV
jgi:2-oxoglutarate dehydrogenase E2 component (dihydrolipoamide succinyltransferase)